MTEISKFKAETVDNRIKRRHVGLDDKKAQHKTMKLLLTKTHDYRACYNVDEYMTEYAGTDDFHSQTIDINLGDRAPNLGTDVAREIAKLSDKSMIPAIILSEHKDDLEEAERYVFKLRWKSINKI